jgi:hypothetical protein
MNVTLTENTAVKKAEIAATGAGSGRLFAAACAVVAVFAALLAAWHFCDHTIPAPDDSSYILGSFQYADLLRHPKPVSLHWWHSMLTVNQVYPPTVMLFNGILRLVFGFGAWINVLSVVIFGAILTGTVYGATRYLTGDERAALIAAIVINLYPQTCCMSHGFALDAPLMAMISAGIFIMLWWRAKPTWGRTITCGFVLGAACLTKQIAAAYLLGPGLYLLVESIVSDIRERCWVKSLRLFSAAIICAVAGLPWLLINLPHIRFLAQDNQAFMGPRTIWQAFPAAISFYAGSFPGIASPLLLGAFAAALLATGKEGFRKLAPLALSAVGGVLAVSTLTWALPSFRYDAPALIAMAAFTGWGASRFWAAFPVVARWLLPAILVLAGLQFLSFNYCPYPVTKPDFIVTSSERLGVKLVETIGLTQRDKRETQVLHSNPLPPEDWGQAWAIETIDRFEGHKAVYLNIMPDYMQINGNTFELVGRMLGSPVRPTTSRRWTVVGDCVKFSPETAMYYQWYLLKSGYQGNLLRDDDSEKNYAQIIDFVQHSGKFNEMASHRLPDGSMMYLYRQK